uniref:Calcium homeostasis modulator family member 2, tandem duplicate 2 n=1 Tax=Sinocyclocheilus rhinocerous TaxID=307959 RepID=A0A673LWD2_9TELE
MTAFLSEYIKFIALYFKSKDVMVFNGLIGLETVVGQTAYNILAFHCPCLPKKNYLYGLTAIGVPALAFFVIGVMLNQSTWDIVSECRTKRCRKLSLTAAFALLGSVVGRAVVVPVTWTVISLLRGEAYVCAFSEFMNPSSLDGFFSSTPGPEIMARFPCKDVLAPFMNYSGEVEHQLKYESQVLVTFYSVVKLLNCMNTSDVQPLFFLHLAYWSQYCSSEQALFQRTAEVHAKNYAAENVKSFFGFVALEDEEKQEIDDTPIYSRLNKWDMYTNEHDLSN